MIVRSTARRKRANLLAASFAQLNLPWLAPAQLRWVASHNTSSTLSTHRSRRRSTGRERRESAPLRRIATSADVVSQPLDDGPLLVGNQQPWTWQDTAPSSESYLRGVKEPIVIDTASRVPSDNIFKVYHAGGVTGNENDLLQHLHTSIRIGRLARARAIVQRLQKGMPVNSPEITYANAAYIEGMLEGIKAHPAGSDESREAFEEMRKWFFEEMYSKSVSISGQTLVHMVSASTHALTDPEREEVINGFVAIGSEISEDAHDEVLFSDEYDDEEFSILSKATDPAAYEDLAPADAETPAMSALEAEVENVAMAHVRQQFQRPDVISLKHLAEVAPTAQLSLGLEDVKKALDPLSMNPALPADAPLDEQHAVAVARQRLMEERSAEIAIGKWRRADEELRKIGINTSMQSKSVSGLMWQWYSALLPALREELDLCRKLMDDSLDGNQRIRAQYAPYLTMLPVEKLAANTILFTISRLSAGKSKSKETFADEAKVTNMSESLGKLIEEECTAYTAGKKLRKSQERKHTRSTSKRRFASARLRQSPTDVLAQQSSEWSALAHSAVGAVLLQKFMDTAELPVTREHIRTKERVTQLQPALMHTMRYHRGKRMGIIQPNPALMSKLQSEPVGSLLSKRMPMIIEPQPWTGFRKGAYYHYKNAIMRLPTGNTGCQEYFQAAHDQGDLTQVYAALTALGKIPWRINLDVLKVQIEAWNSGDAVGNLAPLNPKFEAPKEPEPSADPSARMKWLTELRVIENRKHGIHSQRCFQNFQLEIARTMANDTLYFPHNIDFRGRVYPIPPYLNHMGADNARGLLVFAEGKPLGEEGLRWLKIHLANVAGYDKASLQEREDFTMEHLDDIRDSINDPFGGRKWWLKGEDAWQTLAACFELIHALDSPDPHKFVSHLPVHQDGTCNGLQHYAALGGDKAGAAHVNLEPSDRPADVYTGVLDVVKAEIEADAAAGHEVAIFLKGRIGRKVVKQPVMTNVYGVTSFGATAQVRRQISELFPELRKTEAMNHTRLSQYISKLIFKSLGGMFTGAQAIQEWLGDCADRITRCLTQEQITKLLAEEATAAGQPQKRQRPKSDVMKDVEFDTTDVIKRDKDARDAFKDLFRSTVVWTTPLGLPVVQPYRKPANGVVPTGLQLLSIIRPQVWDPVHQRKQMQGFPPNFIHSLDATHMMLSVLKCTEVGLTFASIHDSFWTHACDVSKMSTILRDAFVAMHSDDIIGRLHEEFTTRYKDALYLTDVPRKHAVADEILAWRRDNCVVSPVASRSCDWRQGEAMTTPASILESAGYEGKVEMGAGAEDLRLGAIPEFEEPQQTKKSPTYGKKLSVWRPIVFPDVPEKGDFDVTRLRESKYFFS
ncbi:hypothetical protein AMS68_005195 [Peltaster fructicola]|uniref:DNA-directed RNA polymerase n=1 Tax=Peltaster fructicola TaxID=286661 RepID=A0A6H0XYK5_9PEZI|nr:hypothetical protein AMS68_005195 [Peltaster fructicola]